MTTNTDHYTITFNYEELDAVYAALGCYELSIRRERENGRADHPERAAQVLDAISTARAKVSERRYPKRPDMK